MHRIRFLDLPREIRFQIYEHVFEFEVECTPLHIDDNRTTTVDAGNRPKICIPWLDLRMTCTTTAAELSAYTSSHSFLRQPEHEIYIFELITGRMTLDSIILQHAPCTPSQAQYLVIDLDVTDLRWFWSYGGVPYPIVSQLFQALNRILHYGPLLSPPLASATEKREPLFRLQEMVINVTSHAGQYTSKPTERAFDVIRDFAFDLCASGALNGSVATVRIVGKAEEECLAVPCEAECEVRLPQSWSGEEFQWGGECLLV